MADEMTTGQSFGSDSNGAVALQDAPVRKSAPSKREPKQLPPWKVLLHNDDVNTFEHVITTVLKLTSLTAEEAFERAVEAHESGVALLLVTHQERAELYHDQFTSCQLCVTIEPTE